MEKKTANSFFAFTARPTHSTIILQSISLRLDWTATLAQQVEQSDVNREVVGERPICSRSYRVNDH